MKRRTVAILLAAALLASLSLSGCGNKQNADQKQDAVTAEVSEKKESTDHEKIKEYIEKADEIVIVKDAKNLDIEKAITSMVTEEQKENVESVVVDDSKVDYTKEGTYPLTITVTVKQEASDQTASTEKSTEDTKKDAETSSEKEKTDSKADVDKAEKDTKTDATESKDTSSTEEKNDAASIEDSKEVIEDTVDVTVAEKEKADDLLEDGSAIIGDDSKVEIKDEQKEESKKEDTKKEENKEESKKDDTSQKTEEKKDETVKKEETKNDASTSNKQETTKKDDNTTNSSSNSAKPSGSSSSSSTNNNTTNSKPSGSTSNNSSSTATTHTHTWVAQTKTVHHDEVGHNEQYVVKAAWDEEVQEAIYDTKVKWICNDCGADCTNDPVGHNEMHLLAYEKGGYHSEYEQVVTGYNTYTVHHDAEYGTRWVVDKAAYDETVTTGYKCSCGATK